MSHYDMVLHVDKTDGALDISLTNAVNYASALAKESFHMVLVVNSRAVTLLVRANEGLAPKLQAACGAGLDIRVCNNALQSTGTKAEDLYPQCTVVPAGLVEIVDLQRNGYAYIKP